MQGMVYLMIAKEQYKDRKCKSYYNVGSDESDCKTMSGLVEYMDYGRKKKYETNKITGLYITGWWICK